MITSYDLLILVICIKCSIISSILFALSTNLDHFLLEAWQFHYVAELFTLLSCSCQNAGPFFEWVGAGLTSVKISGFRNGTVDLTSAVWSYKVSDSILQKEKNFPKIGVIVRYCLYDMCIYMNYVYSFMSLSYQFSVLILNSCL